ncbi:RNA polymerase sigma factor RpoD [Parapedobacter pyrenivorans]|uniref:RNA polymerase sigma factor RpoD n=2 Tax=Parapedobacter pyrenivorans TaxID=1305674 RepID=A0A917MAI2_9SPHI|nr:RNA polymerase sigma factor RpoD/SigA [Parapedobacter pyrenivorans]GGG88068.1 RNA polymerase sigma factor RpoD [Parapedobacter pyrenivorans]
MRQLKISESITNRANRSLNSYLLDISKYDMLAGDEEVALAIRIRAGDTVALNRLVKGNLRFVISVAKQFQHQGVLLEDLINEGNLGLVTAAKRFDETRGFKFISYAVWWIRQSIMLAISVQSRTVRLPINQIADLVKVKRSQSELEQRLEREPTVEELADVLGVPSERLGRTLSNGERQVSIDAPSLHSPDICLLDSLPDVGVPTDHRAMRDSLEIVIGDAIRRLPQREQLVLSLFFGLGGSEPKRLGEISRQMGLTTERVRQIKAKALAWLQHSTEGKKLAPFRS